ncbi:hypothetical protein [Streptomyces sp. NPDC007094]|uniref:hypothetical protein n=1 Tax=Streptomyces sp. NPDC007094 TaxID=3155359 RepID=UPI0033CA0B70
MVRMRHDGIEQVIEVAEISVAQYKRMGWQVVGDQPAETTTAEAKRRRTPKENG